MISTTDNMIARRAEFLAKAGWADAHMHPLTGDASSRSYERLTRVGQSALLMNAPPGAETAACPPDANANKRRNLGYNAMARLAGPNLHAFVSISERLRVAGLSAPDIYVVDPENGFALIEDLGDDLYTNAIASGADELQLYRTAIDALITLRSAKLKPVINDQYRMLNYDDLAMKAEVDLLPEWYWEHKASTPIAPDLKIEYQALWSDIINNISAPHLMVLRDFHAENLLWLPDRKAAARVGVIDFQDGLYGHAAYDLVSLLEDARRDVDPLIAEKTLTYYCQQASGFTDFDEERLRSDYAILGAQRNSKILGIFARLIKRDQKPRYLQFIPRVEAHFRRNLLHPELTRLKKFFQKSLPELSL